MYQLLFCDDATLFRVQPGMQPAPWQSVLFGAETDADAVRKLAEDTSQESRVRMLAYNWLRLRKETVSSKELLGVVVEVPLERGLDTLAAYADGRVRYINQTGKMAILETATGNVRAQAERVLAASRIAVGRIGPWDKARLPPPAKGRIRMTFLVADGLYFGEGPLPGMDRDTLAGPIIGEAGKLLQMVVDMAAAPHSAL